MKVVVLGGAGDMGSAAVWDLAAQPQVERITIADYNFEGAQRLAQLVGDKAQALWVDANDHDLLVQVIAGHDAAAGAIGPFYKYEAKMARAAIEAGVPYVSLCDDYDAAQAVLEMDPLAKEKGVTVITGLGWTPGLSNVLARRAADQLDEVDEIHVAWAGSASDSEGYAVILHTIHIFTGMVPSFQNGELVSVPAGSGRELVRFPDPVGDIYVYHLGHPEPVTLPRFLPGVKTVTLKGGLSEDELNRLAMFLNRVGLTRTPARKDALGKVIKMALPLLSRIGAPEEPCSAIRVDVHGRKNGKPQLISYGAADHMNRLTGIPLAIGTVMLGAGQIKEKGVLAPEACIDPRAFLRELEKRNIIIHDMTRYVPALREPKGGISLSRAILFAGVLALLAWWAGRRSRG